MMTRNFNAETKVWSGIQEPWVLNPKANLGSLILDILLRNPDEIGQICADTGVKLMNREIRLRTIRAAQNLTKLGVKKGDFVGVAASNSENLAPIIFGCILIGAPFHTLAPSYQEDDLAYMMATTKPVLMLCDKSNFGVVQKAADISKIMPKIYVLSSEIELVRETGCEHEFYPEYLGDSKMLLAAVLCSSGTTGRSKAVCLTHSQLTTTCSILRHQQPQVLFNFSCVFWATGLIFLLQGTLNQWTRVITTDQFTVELMLDIIKKYKVTTIFSQPSYAAEISKSDQATSETLSSIQHWYSGGSVVPEPIRNALNKLLPNGKALNCYGCSEVGYLATEFDQHKVGSVGQLMPNNFGKIVDDNGNAVENGTKGEICIKFEFIFSGYYGKGKIEYKEMVDDFGWVHTGDIGYFDDEGFLFVVGRKKEIIKYRGMQISPVDIESVVSKMDGIKEICVVGILNPEGTTDLPTAVIVKAKNSELTIEKVMNFANETLPDYKRLLGGVHFIENSLPKTHSGKILRRKVKELVLENLKQ